MHQVYLPFMCQLFPNATAFLVRLAEAKRCHGRLPPCSYNRANTSSPELFEQSFDILTDLQKNCTYLVWVLLLLVCMYVCMYVLLLYHGCYLQLSSL